MSKVEMRRPSTEPGDPSGEVFAIETPLDRPYAGTLVLHVDATDVGRGIFNVRQRIPVTRSGHLVLLYPKWLPGFHAPIAPIELFAGLRIKAGDAELAWRRHPVAVHAFLIDVPRGVDAIEAEFAFLSPTDPSQGRVICSPDLFCLPWHSVVLYPAGHAARQIAIEAHLAMPEGWRHACALTEKTCHDSTVAFEPVALDTLVDSPVLAGRYMRRIPLGEDVTLNVAADEPDLLDATDAQIAGHRAVVSQARLLFGSKPYDRFEMLLGLSNSLSTVGIEHHRSFEAVSDPGYFTDWTAKLVRRSTVPHEFIHSWNGKHRRGADSCSPSFDQPIRNDLLWVYEGQTQYWTNILCARSGLWSAEETLGALALTAARYDVRPGSLWRPLLDTTRDPIIAARSPLPWPSWQRSEDYYAEGALVWLDVDTRLRELTGEARSLDDFARAFFGGSDGDWSTRPYVFQDVLDTLEAVAPFAWADFFKDALGSRRAHAPLAGLERGGYRLVYRDRPNCYQEAQESAAGQIDLTHILGVTISIEGRVGDVLWDGPAFAAGLTAGATIVAVDGREFSAGRLRHVVSRAAGGELELLVQRADAIRPMAIGVPDAMRYPHLERIGGAPARLDHILDPRRQ
ncbi:M61 family metallopeptidase [Sphingomonas sp. Xoc002]|uniref:M61 family metallopeptidase n=1 Tax=Sphingomonas sp. Xoc002 TaxID=2837624 RepID=UPI003D17C124